MASSWPTAYDFSFPGFPYMDNTEFVLAVYANSWISAIQALETGIGYGSGSTAANPLYSVAYNKTFATITARIANVEADANTSVNLNSSAANILPVAATASAGSSGLGADARHVHVGVSSFAGRVGAITIQGSDFGSMFSAAGGLIAGTGLGTSEILLIGPANSFLNVGGADSSGLQWKAAEWVSGDLKFTAALNFGSAWQIANGNAISRASFASLLAAVTIPFTGTASGSTINGISSSTTSLLSIGQVIEGPNLGTSSTITGVGATSITTSNPPTSGAGSFTVFPSGNGNGSTTFNLPDMRGRSPVGAYGPGGNSQPTFGMGATGGEQNHSLSLSEGPAHGHTDTGHAHLVNPNSGGFQPVIGLEGTTGTWAAGGNGSQFGPGGLGLNVDNILFTTTNSAQLTGSGSGSPHNNESPFLAGQWLIHV